MDYKKSLEYALLKSELAKSKEDVEQVVLFGMQRDDFEEKQQRCREIIEELRQLEKELETNEEE